jgi:uncharacterized membrane protein (UPF0127 family)
VVKVSKIKIGNNIFNTLVAITEDEHVQGLMYIDPPAPIMSFPYKNAKIRKFWMKNTKAPLDILFCFNNKILDIYTGEPYSLDLIGPDLPADLVIETPKGFCKSNNIIKDIDVKLIYGIDSLSKWFNVSYFKTGNLAD